MVSTELFDHTTGNMIERIEKQLTRFFNLKMARNPVAIKQHDIMLLECHALYRGRSQCVPNHSFPREHMMRVLSHCSTGRIPNADVTHVS